MTVDNVLKAISILENIDPTDEFAYEQAFMSFRIFQRLPVLVYNINYQVELFRARTHFEDIFFRSKSEISLAPHKAIDKFARCNRPFQAKFYCGENRPTAYMELVDYWVKEKAVGESLFVTIGRWKIKKSISALIICSPDKENRHSAFDQEHGSALDDFLNDMDGEFKEANVLLNRFLFERFRKPAKDDPLTYIITSAYCNTALFQDSHQIDAVCYPSVPYGGQGINFAINNRFINDDNIELLGVLRNEFLVDIENNGKKSFHEVGTIHASGIEENNNLIRW
jgi:hypothetical protein